MPDYLGDEMRKVKKDEPEKEEKEKEIKCNWKYDFYYNIILYPHTYMFLQILIHILNLSLIHRLFPLSKVIDK